MHTTTRVVFKPETAGSLVNCVTSHKMIRETFNTRIEWCIDPVTKNQYVQKTLLAENRFLRRGLELLFAREVATNLVIPQPHPNLATLADAYVEMSDYKNELKLLYHFEPMGDLYDNSTTRPSKKWVQGVFRDIIEGLRALNQAGLIHRDVKTENVLITKNGTAALCDFAFCEWIHPRDYDSNQPLFHQSPEDGLVINIDRALAKVTHQVVGTSGCVPPEIYKLKEHATLSTDMFSLGVMLYEVLTGKHAFPEDDTQKITPPPVAMPKFPRSMAPDAKNLIRSLIAPNPQDRPDSLDQVLQHSFFLPQ